jgi:2-(1,2-epoxy-1,2-dihydrophenyl)acetyl-CoA isomerase
MLPTPPTIFPELTTLLYEADQGVATITLNRPERHNSMTVAMLDEMYALLRVVAGDPEVRILIITGAGGPGNGFCPGADLVAMSTGEAESQRQQSRESGLEAYRVSLLLHNMAPVTIAAMNGAAAGAGLGWACACDIRVAASSARFSTAFLDRAVAGDMALPWSLPRIIGAAKAREICFFPDKFTADDALKFGLVCRVFDDGEFRPATAALAERLRRVSPPALKTLKANFIAAERMALEEYVDYETMRHSTLLASDAAQDGLRSFYDGREKTAAI